MLLLSAIWPPPINCFLSLGLAHSVLATYWKRGSEISPTTLFQSAVTPTHCRSGIQPWLQTGRPRTFSKWEWESSEPQMNQQDSNWALRHHNYTCIIMDTSLHVIDSTKKHFSLYALRDSVLCYLMLMWVAIERLICAAHTNHTVNSVSHLQLKRDCLLRNRAVTGFRGTSLLGARTDIHSMIIC